MKTKIIEATNAEGGGGINWGKFMVARMDSEMDYVSEVEGAHFMRRRWGDRHLWVMDLETGEGAVFAIGGYATVDLEKHRIWVCPMFEPFLNWLYEQDITDLDALPSMVRFTEAEAPSAMGGYRRKGPE